MEQYKKKQQVWDLIYPQIKHLESYFTLDLRGIKDDSEYFHPQFILDDNFRIETQCDVESTYMYAYKCHIKNGERLMCIEIDESIFDAIVIGYSVNKDLVLYALQVMSKIQDHTYQLRDYCNDYIRNLLIGNSVDEVSNAFINEIKTTSAVIKAIQKNNRTINEEKA
jgi:hypothetical protein